MGALLRRREPAVVVLLLLVLAREVLVLGFGLAALVGAAGPYGLAAYAAAGEAEEPVAIALLAALAVACHLAPATARARTLAVLALVVVAVAVLMELVVLLLGLTRSELSGLQPPLGVLEVVERLLRLVVPVLALLALAVLLRRPAAVPDVVDRPALPVGESDDGEGPVQTEPDPALQPTWQPDVAAGAVWLSAGDAASGRPPTTAGPATDQDEPHPWASGPR
jgi:hypothetical protein